MREELARLRQLFPDLRQEGAAVTAIFEHDAIHAGAQLRQRIGLVANNHLLGSREQRDLDCGDVEFFRAQRRKTRIVQGGGHGVAFYVGEQWPVRLQRADAAAQFA